MAPVAGRKWQHLKDIIHTPLFAVARVHCTHTADYNPHHARVHPLHIRVHAHLHYQYGVRETQRDASRIAGR